MPDAPPADGDESVPLLWRWLPLRLALAALPLAPTFTVLAFNVGPFIRSIAAVTLGVTLVSPVHGLLLTAAIAPFGELIAAFIGATNFRISEVVVLAFLTGWLLRWLPDRRGPRVAAPAAGWLFAIAVAASIAGLAWQLGRYPGELPATIDQIVHGYFYSLRAYRPRGRRTAAGGDGAGSGDGDPVPATSDAGEYAAVHAGRVCLGRRAVERAALARHRDRGGAAALPADRLPRQRARRRRQRRRQLLRDDRLRRARHGAARSGRPPGALVVPGRGERRRLVVLRVAQRAWRGRRGGDRRACCGRPPAGSAPRARAAVLAVVVDRAARRRGRPRHAARSRSRLPRRRTSGSSSFRPACG